MTDNERETSDGAPSSEESSPSEPPPPIYLTLKPAQAGVMCSAGLGLSFCGGLLGVTAWQGFVPWPIKIALALTVLFLAWFGLSLIWAAIDSLKRPVFTLHADRLVGHDLRGDWEAPLSAIESREFETRAGVRALALQIDGRRVAIPETLRHSEQVFERLGPAAETESGTADGAS